MTHDCADGGGMQSSLCDFAVLKILSSYPRLIAALADISRRPGPMRASMNPEL